ncbi:MAG: alpha/beta hydrolase [Deltaproteobacteria bacterium]|nr:MAG: alpha/beta hydrolase [Deltaproteobacteria bacterium]
MFEQPRFYREAWIPIAAGFAFFAYSTGLGFIGWTMSLLLGSLLLASGMAELLWPGDRRIHQFAALAGAIGTVFGLLGVVSLGIGSALLLGALSAASFVAAGHLSVRQEPHAEEVPEPVPTLSLAAKVALDDAILATMQVGVGMPRGDDQVRIRHEVAQARELFEARGWLEKPADYHPLPPPLEAPRIAPARVRSISYERLAFESGYEPHPEEPGRERWLARRANRTAHAWIVRDGDEPRPWLVGIHGYQMGKPRVDLLAFRPEWLHRRLGFNLAIPTLPLHGPRTVGRRSGDGFLIGDVLDTVHAEAQAMWDIRRLLGWIRAQGAPAIAVYGLSLGGYNTALLASLEAELDCAIAGIPATDFTSLAWLHAPPLQLRYAEHLGMSVDTNREVMGVVSPLVLEPRIPHDRRFLFAGVSDRLVPPVQVRDLWRHWERPKIVWYQGGHLTFRADARVIALIEDALRAAAGGAARAAAAPA